MIFLKNLKLDTTILPNQPFTFALSGSNSSFFFYQPTYYNISDFLNPVYVTFNISGTPCTPTVSGIFVCNLTLCSWGDIKSQVPNINPYSLTYNGCGCNSYSDPNGSWLLRVDNPNTSLCSIDFKITQRGFLKKKTKIEIFFKI